MSWRWRSARATYVRDFQGYSRGGDCDLIGLGVRAIGNVGPTYSQNVKHGGRLLRHARPGDLPVMRGLESADDLCAAPSSSALTCRFTFQRSIVTTAYLLDFDDYFKTELRGLVRIRPTRRCVGLVAMKTITRYAERTAARAHGAMVFDRYLRQDRERRRYSRVI